MTEHSVPVVLDASAVLAFLQDKSGSDAVGEILEAGAGMISTVNYAEIIGKLLERGLPDQAVENVLDHLELNKIPLDEDQAWITGRLRPPTKKWGLSTGDRACLALAMTRQHAVMTTNKQWKNLDIAIDIILIR